MVEAQRDERALLREYLEAMLIAVIFATFARTFLVQPFKIPSSSMEQNLLVGDHILVNKFVYGPTSTSLERLLLPHRDIRRGDVVVFKFPLDPTIDYIKRCVGLPGDEIRLESKELFLNDEPVDDSGYTYHVDTRVYPSSRLLGEADRYRDNFGPVQIEPERYFCLGDNRDNSSDSRSWGQVPRQNVKGRALMIYWSFAPSEEADPSTSDRWPRWQRLSRVLSSFFAETRWERTFKLVR